MKLGEGHGVSAAVNVFGHSKSTSVGYFMDPAIISAGILKTSSSVLAQPALLCPAL